MLVNLFPLEYKIKMNHSVKVELSKIISEMVTENEKKTERKKIMNNKSAMKICKNISYD